MRDVDAALEVCAKAISGPGFHVMRTSEMPWWVSARNWRVVKKAMELHGPDVSVSMVPKLEIGNFRLCHDPGCLWVRVETGDSARRLAKFNPEPTLVLREGSTVRHVAIWWLTVPCPAEKLERANGRLSYRVGAKKMWGSPGFEFRPPGAVVRLKRKELTVEAVGGTAEPVPAGRLLNGLKDRPPPPDWRRVA